MSERAAATGARAASAARSPDATGRGSRSGPLGPEADLFAVQRAIGNRALSHLLGPGGEAGIVRRACAACSAGGAPCPDCDEDEKVVRREPSGAAGPVVPGVAGGPVEGGVRSYLAGTIGRGAALHPGARRALEASFGRGLDRVRIHADTAAARAASRLGAAAFTLGETIWFGRGQYRPATVGGLRLLAHEIAHTIQQRGHPGRLQPRLLVGAVDDPAERLADRAAEAALGGAPVPDVGGAGGTAGAVLRRAVRSVSSGADADEKVVEMDDGTRYRVRRVRTIGPSRGGGFRPPTVKGGIDRDKVTIRIEWCRGTRGNVEIGANAPEQVRDLFQRLVGVIRRGGTSSEVLRELEGTDVTPFVNFDIAQSGAWRVTGGIDMTVGAGGVTAGGGRIGVRRGPVDVDIRGRGGTGGPGGGPDWSVGGTVTVTPGRKDETFDCPRERVEFEQRTTYECRRERRIPPRREPRTRNVPRADQRSRYIYFRYAEDVIDDARSAGELTALAADLADGYRLTNVRAFASPEGPMAARGRFRGNERLAQDRAVAALRRVETLCPGGAGAAAGCPVAGDRNVSPAGAGELYTIERPPGEPEAAGAELETHAVEEFERQEAEERHRTPELSEQIARARTPAAKARLVYPMLRRAEVVLTKTIMVAEQYMEDIPGRTELNAVACPDEVREAAVSSFRALP